MKLELELLINAWDNYKVHAVAKDGMTVAENVMQSAIDYLLDEQPED